MNNSTWRSKAKVVAYVDLVLTSILLLVVIIGILLASTFTGSFVTQDNYYLNEIFQQVETTVLWWAWAFLTFLAVITVVQMWAALKLLSACEVGRVPYEALDKARIWRNVTIVFLVFQIIGDIVIWSALSIVGLVLLLVHIFCRGGSLYVVCNFIKELESAVSGTSDGVETGQSYPISFISK